jgi:hypothetical protein
VIAVTPRLITAAVAVVAIAALGWRVNAWRTDAVRLDVLEREFSNYKATIAERDRREKEASDEYQKELDATRGAARARHPVRSVRLCPPAADPVHGAAGSHAAGKAD